MSVLQDQIVQKISGLSEENLQFLLEMIDRFMQPETKEKRIWQSQGGLELPKGRICMMTIMILTR